MLTTVVIALTVILVVATGLSFLRIPHGFVRVMAFPRIQFLIAALVLLAVTFAAVPSGLIDTLLVVALVSVAMAQALLIVQFTPLRRKQSAQHEGDPAGPDTVAILSYNVKLSNKEHAKAVALPLDNDVDIALFMETDQIWADALEPLREKYRYVVSHPLDNAYGMILFSRLELAETEVKYLILDEVPSIMATVVLRDGQRFRLYCVHPEPPVPHVDSLGRDAELMRVAGLVERDPMPAVVAGDLNDVAWSNTSRMFQRLSRLLDPRVGRGFYNTFDTRFPFMRWPLDHLFHDARFSLVSIKRLPNAGSDHFPMWFKLALAGQSVAVEMPEEPDAADHAEAADIKRNGDRLKRDPIGTDWEG